LVPIKKLIVSCFCIDVPGYADSEYIDIKLCMCMPPVCLSSFIDYSEDCINYKITFTVFFFY